MQHSPTDALTGGEGGGGREAKFLVAVCSKIVVGAAVAAAVGLNYIKGNGSAHVKHGR